MKTEQEWQDEIEDNGTQKVKRWVILRLLLDSENWVLRDKGLETEEIVHKDGWRYYSSCHCVTIRKEGSRFEQLMGVFMYMIVAPLAWINTRKVKRAR